ncbi:MOSC domain-containing protein [Gaetbulibacter aquiaggeris]|uniref:MOSC domain-containing protein n=1 Tax=Gaetbulibacter aquiaggeris TaxID=1735373 RepID=A0ABW7MN19_9FLAO
MQIISTNIAQPTTIVWNGQEVVTGIFKTPINKSIFLGKHDVKGDEVTDRIHHGGEYKACYMFSADQYPYWKNLYPHLNWQYGMLGENLTVSGFDECQIMIGSIYKIGKTLIQITQPREPCFKFGVKFGTQEVLKQFIDHGFPGTYVRVLEEGLVKTGDTFKLIESAKDRLSVYDFFNLLFLKVKDQKLLKLAIENEAIPLKKRVQLKAFIH